MVLGLLVGLAAAAPCAFDADALTFAGTPNEQAVCLTREVRQWGHIGEPREHMPQPLEGLIGQPTTIPRPAIAALLARRDIAQADVGGPIEGPICRARDNAPGAPTARYFVIHDTSTPGPDMNAPFPPDMDGAGWVGNNLETWRGRPVGHIFVNRMGQSITTADFARPSWWATKFERDHLDEQAGLFINIELMQPRRREPTGGARNDALAPDPGFTDAQLDRLALLYLLASVRKGEWLIPAFHGVLDTTIPNAHDDPQNFDLDRWAARLQLLLAQLQDA